MTSVKAVALPSRFEMAHLFICPNCGNRSTATDRSAGFRNQPKGCSKCGFGFLFELLDDYYPAPNAAFFVCDQEGRVIGCGRGARELTGLSDEKVIGRPVNEVLGLSFDGGDDHVSTVLEWGVRQRVDAFGVSEPELSQLGQNQIQVNLPGVSDAQRAANQVGSTAQLFLYDWEANILDDSCKTNPDTNANTEQPITGLYKAVRQAAKCKPQHFPNMNAGAAPRFYAFDK